MKKKEKPQFFCDHCGSEVPQEATECPQCGRSFASVRCPICGFIGEGDLFNQGCPGCGYAAPGISETEAGALLGAPPGIQKQRRTSPNPSPLGTLPLWVYILTGILFLGALMVLYFSIKS